MGKITGPKKLANLMSPRMMKVVPTEYDEDTTLKLLLPIFLIKATYDLKCGHQLLVDVSFSMILKLVNHGKSISYHPKEEDRSAEVSKVRDH